MAPEVPQRRDPESIEGEWWLPDNAATRLAGKLTAGPAEAAELVLEGLLVSGGETETLPAILGQSRSGEDFTLEGCTATPSSDFPVKQVSADRLHVSALRVYKGRAATDIHLTPVTGAQFELDYLTDWLGAPRAIQQARDPQLPPPIFASMRHGVKVTIAIVPGPPRDDAPEWRKVQSVVQLAWPQPLGLREADHAIHRLRNLLALAMARAPKIRNVSFTTSNGSIEDVLTLGTPAEDSWVRLGLPQGGWRADDLLPTLSRSLDAWWQLEEDARPVVDVLIGDLFYRRDQVPAPFLALATALEGYHRLQIERNPRHGPTAAKDPATRAKQKVEKTWLLSHRLEDLFDQVSAEVATAFPEGPAQAVAEVRNYYAHFFRGAVGAANRPRTHLELQELTRFARTLLMAHVMHAIGIGGPAIGGVAKYWSGFTTFTLPGYEP